MCKLGTVFHSNNKTVIHLKHILLSFFFLVLKWDTVIDHHNITSILSSKEVNEGKSLKASQFDNADTVYIIDNHTSTIH